LYSNVVKFVRRKSVKSCVISRDQKNNKTSAASQNVATAWIAPKICHSQPPVFGSHCSRFNPSRFTFGGVIAERVKAVFCPIEYIHNRLFEPIKIKSMISPKRIQLYQINQKITCSYTCFLGLQQLQYRRCSVSVQKTPDSRVC